MPVGGNIGFHCAPQALTDTKPSGKVTKTFANEATLHSNAERRVNAERTAASAQSLAFIKTRLEASAASAPPPNVKARGKKGFNDAAQGTLATLPGYRGK
jgi:hypothetical protein